MAAVDEQTLLHDVEQRFLRLSQKLEACEKERDDLRASQGKSDEQISALTLSQSAALRGEAGVGRSAGARRNRLDAAYKAALERAGAQARVGGGHEPRGSGRASAVARSAEPSAASPGRRPARPSRQARRVRAPGLGGPRGLAPVGARRTKAPGRRRSASQLSGPRAPARPPAPGGEAQAQAEALKAAETRSAAAAGARSSLAAAAPRRAVALRGDLAAEKRLAVALVDEADAAARDRDAFEETAKKAEASEAALRANLDAEVARLKARSDERRRRGVRAAASGPAAMYERAVDAERAAERARAELKRNELYLERVAREVEKKAEVFDREVAARKSAVAAYDALAIKHHGALQELEQSKTDAAAALKRAREEKHERSDLERSKRDLALQVQELLRVRTGKSPSGLVEARLKKNSAEEQALGEQLVVFDDVAGLQQRNEQLLRVVRKLAAEAEAKKLEEAEGETSGALEQALKDLEDLKSKREQQETMVRAVVAQRDSYRDQLRARGEVAAIVAAPAAAALTADPAAAALRRAEVEADLEAAARGGTSRSRPRPSRATRARGEARARGGARRQGSAATSSTSGRGAAVESSAEASRLGEQAALAEAAGLHRQLDRRTDDHEKLVEDKAAWMDEKADLARAKKAADDALDGARAAKQDAEAKVEALSRENDKLVAALDGVRKLENALDAKSEAEVTSLRSRLEAAENQRCAAAQELALSQETHRLKADGLQHDLDAARGAAQSQAERDGAAAAATPSPRQRAAADRAAQSAATARDAYERELGLPRPTSPRSTRPPPPPAPAPAAVDDEAAKRLAALERQNELLHAQIAVSVVDRRRLQRRGGALAGGGDAAAGAESDAEARLRELREVVLFVRREKSWPRRSSRCRSGRGRAEARAQTSDDALATVRVERDALLEQRDAGPGGLGEHAQNAEREQASLLRESNASLRADAAKHKAAAEALRAQLDKVHASHVEPKHKLVAQLKAQVATKEQERASHERDASAWRKRVDALLSKVTEKIDADEYRAVEEKLRKAEDQLADATEAAAAAKRELGAAKTKIESLDAAHASDAAAAAQRYLRSLRADGLHRRSLTDAAAAAEKVKARADAADASNVALKDELVRAEAKVRKAAGMMRQYKAQNAALQVKVDAVPAAPPAAAVPVPARPGAARRARGASASGAAPAPAPRRRR
ncbi:hypothetical protein JL721_8709 [Aureococcus anophagefferens]|nr:hypothetical protein JL721_8709 [Aureococcus anophagefferens]